MTNADRAKVEALLLELTPERQRYTRRSGFTTNEIYTMYESLRRVGLMPTKEGSQ